MTARIVVYSLTGTTRSVGRMLADRLGGELSEIRCDRYRPGAFGFARGILDSLLALRPPVEGPRLGPGDDLLVIGAPVWAGRPAPPLRSWLAGRPALPARIGLFVTAGGSGSAGALEEMRRLLGGRPVAATLALREAEVRAGTPAGLEAFVAELRQPQAGA